MTASRFTRSRPSRIIPKRDGPEDSKGDGVKKLDWTTRNPSRGEMTASATKRGRRHLCKSIYSFQFFIHLRGILVGNFRVRTLVDFCSYFRVSNPLFFHVKLKISYPLIIQYVYVLFDYIVCFSFF